MNLSQFSLQGKVALVTGASSGIGYGVAAGMAAAGAKVVVAARRIDRLEELVSVIERDGGQALAVSLDVTDKESIAAAFDTAQAEFGVVDTLVNNAGIADESRFPNVDDDTLERVMDTNFTGVWNVAQAAAHRMIAADIAGSITNIASILGLRGHKSSAAYCASKGAVVQATRAMALDLVRHGIRVNALAPGWFVTEMNEHFLTSDKGKAYLKATPARRAGKVDELVGPIILLASSAGSFINGAILPVDGAHSATLV